MVCLLLEQILDYDSVGYLGKFIYSLNHNHKNPDFSYLDLFIPLLYDSFILVLLIVSVMHSLLFVYRSLPIESASL